MANSRLCSIPECGKKHFGHGYCQAHYWRWSQHGDPLGGSTGWGEAQRYFRETVLAYDGDNCLPWPYSKNGAGYGLLYVHEVGSKVLVTRLVCQHSHGPAPSPDHQAAHSCGNGHLSCCTKRHLSWKTRKGNSADSINHGVQPRGESHGRAKLSLSEVEEIRSLGNALSQAKIGAMFGVSQSQIGRILRRQKWS